MTNDEMLTKVFDGQDVRIIEGEPRMVVLKDVSSAMGYSHTHQVGRNISDRYKEKHKIQTSGGCQEMITATRKGLLQGLSSMRDPKAKEMLEQLGQDIEWATLTSIEESVVRSIQVVFSPHKIEYQKWFGSFRVDLFLPEFGLIIEIDENGHADRNGINEAQRQQFLESSGFKVIRYDANSEPIEMLFQSIHQHIINQ